MSWEGRDPARDEDEPRSQKGLCPICALGFHTNSATTGCSCLGYGCGCRNERELKEAA